MFVNLHGSKASVVVTLVLATGCPPHPVPAKECHDVKIVDIDIIL